jgi:hypothetical protein
MKMYLWHEQYDCDHEYKLFLTRREAEKHVISRANVLRIDTGSDDDDDIEDIDVAREYLSDADVYTHIISMDVPLFAMNDLIAK